MSEKPQLDLVNPLLAGRWPLGLARQAGLTEIEEANATVILIYAGRWVESTQWAAGPVVVRLEPAHQSLSLCVGGWGIGERPSHQRSGSAARSGVFARLPQ
jgi:hypothetical protein